MASQNEQEPFNYTVNQDNHLKILLLSLDDGRNSEISSSLILSTFSDAESGDDVMASSGYILQNLRFVAAAAAAAAAASSNEFNRFALLAVTLVTRYYNVVQKDIIVSSCDTISDYRTASPCTQRMVLPQFPHRPPE